MANAEQLALLKAGVEGWNKWRKKKPDEMVDLSGADLGKADIRRANLSEANLIGASLWETNLRGADLNGAELFGANLSEANLRGAILYGANLRAAGLIAADLSGADLSEAILYEANLWRAKLRGANLSGAELAGASFLEANLTGADIRGANLSNSNLVGANISNAKISQSHVYGVNVWDLEGEFKEQKDLIITPGNQPSITVDNIKVAQFIYLILNNKEIRDVINTLTSKSVLILGRFAIPERKAILDTLRNKLREYDLLPIVFDFDRPTDKDLTETIKTLAGMCYFVIADVTNPKSSPLELQATVPDYQVPFVPIIQEGEYPFAMMVDLQKKYNWVLDTISYDSVDTLIEILKPHIIDPAIKKRDELRLIKAKEPTIISGRDLLSKQ
jgi:uncharacterized protein YjbI with pentapeptide repeats